MRISVVTAVRNRRSTIDATLASVAMQQAVDLEPVVVDGMSSDGTSEIIAARSSMIATSLREPDDGIYDALNKGIRASTGDVVGFLHADDLLATPHALAAVRDKFDSGDYDAVYADLVYVQSDNPDQVVRYWRSGDFHRGRFRRGWMPPHPTVYVRRHVYEKLGMYLTDFGSAADYECLVRLMVRHQIRVGYVPEVTVKMRLGGESNATINNRIAANRDDRRAWVINGLKPPTLLRFSKPLRKLPQYWCRPSEPSAVMDGSPIDNLIDNP